mgnify:CR=1 FL=1
MTIKALERNSRMPAISVIIPNYNTEKFIASTIESVLNQTFSDFELIIVDDGSSDNSVAVIQSYAAKDPRIQLVENPHKGLSHTRMDGLSKASGEWINYMDSDDLIHSKTLELMMRCASDPSVDMIQIRHSDFSETSELNLQSEQSDSPHSEICTGKESFEFSRGHVPNYAIKAGPWGKLYRRTLFEKPEIVQWLHEAGQKFPYNYFNDFSLIPLLQYFSREVILLDIILYYHRVHPGNISANPYVGPTHYERVQVVDAMIQFYEAHNFQTGIYVNITNYFLFILSYWYKGWLTDRGSAMFLQNQADVSAFYKKYLHYLNEIPNPAWTSFGEKMVIKLWRFSKPLWVFLVGNLYFEKKYHYKQSLRDKGST